jgi:hypothetical protein
VTAFADLPPAEQFVLDESRRSRAEMRSTAAIKGHWSRLEIDQCREVKLGMIKSRVVGGVSRR